MLVTGANTGLGFQIVKAAAPIKGMGSWWMYTSLLRTVGQRPMGSEAKDTCTSLVIALPYDYRLVPSSLVVALLLGPPWC